MLAISSGEVNLYHEIDRAIHAAGQPHLTVKVDESIAVAAADSSMLCSWWSVSIWRHWSHNSAKRDTQTAS
jgi:outer membrane protease